MVAMRWPMSGLVVFALACDTKEGEAACDPFAPDQQVLELAEVFAAGEDQAGTIYVIDDDGFLGGRVFMGDEGTLVRHYASGPSGGGGIEVYRVDHDPPLDLQLDTTGPETILRLFVSPTSQEQAFDTEGGEVLSPIASDDLAEMTFLGYPDGLHVEYATELDDGRYFTVLKPREIESDDDYRAFFGPLDQMAEVDIVYFLRLKDGGTTTIDLEIDGQAATAHIPVVWVGQDTELGPSTFTIGDEVHSLGILAKEPLVGAVYHCLP
jgi:hypothetical protein